MISRGTCTLLLSAAAALQLIAAGDGTVAGALRLPGGTPVLLRFADALSSADAHVNDRVEFRVAREVRVGQSEVIPKDGMAWGVVIDAAPRGRMARAGKLSIHIQAACTADGQAVPLRAIERTDAPAGSPGGESGLADTLVALPAWPVMLFLYGKDVKIAAGTEVTAYTDRTLAIDPLAIRSNRTPGACSAEPQAAVPVTDACTATVRSDPDGAEIYVDGKYVGNTPSRLRLAPGEHQVRVTAKSRRAWQRNVTTAAGADISIAAVLEPDALASGSRLDPAAALSAGK